MQKIVRPVFLIDKNVCLRNIEKMMQKSRSNHLKFRPHFKTHQSAAIGNWFREAGTEAITVSSVTMAQYFAQNGWDDITIAFPVNVREASAINELASKIRLNLLVENTEVLSLLKKRLTAPVGVYIEIDTGYFRSGVEIHRVNQVDELLSLMKGCKRLHFKGFLTHNGQTYSARNQTEIVLRHTDSLMKMRSLKEHYRDRFPHLEISLGDTPACSIVSDFNGADEIRPGNFIFYDLMQWQIGSCSEEDIGATVVCPVVSRHLTRGEFVIYGGAVHLSKEFILHPLNKKSYGAVRFCDFETGEKASPYTWVSGLSQEHGIIKSHFDDSRKFRLGGLVSVIPVHSCLAANLTGHYLTTDGEVIHKMPW